MHITRKRPDTLQGPAENFTGTVWLDETAAPASPSRLRMFNVHFAPGAHTAWHRIEPGERHWHGAGPRTFMTHLTVVEAAEDGTTAHWETHVDAAEYPA
ncbi:cupin domain-containing protein [Streptomyces sp. NPDC046909]|uniref:cupin domain-containing protein n=1 Tax=Streptomyces sp. NPDC046909 TaxID=3155617 RepID=UPI0033D534B0